MFWQKYAVHDEGVYPHSYRDGSRGFEKGGHSMSATMVGRRIKF